jgi:ADP-ribosylglycohydrolase
MNESTLFKKVFGCIAGGAIGDALGAPVENCHYKQIQEAFGVLREFVPPFKGKRTGIKNFSQKKELHWLPDMRGVFPFGTDGYQAGNGKYTDDMNGRLLNYLAIIKYGRRINLCELDEFIKQFAMENLKHTDEWRREWARRILTTPITRRVRLTKPVFDFYWGSPGGVINAGNPTAGAEDGCVLGAAVAEAFKPDATVDSVIQAALDHADSFAYIWDVAVPEAYVWGVGVNVWRLSEEFYWRAMWVLDIAEKVDDVFEIRKYLYGEDSVDTLLVAYPPWDLVYPLEMLPTALGLIKIAKGDPWTALVGGANFGRDCDSIACIAGEITGALKGVDTLPKHMVEAVQEANPEPDMREIAEKITRIILINREKTSKKLGFDKYGQS